MWTAILVCTAAFVLLPSPSAVHASGVFELKLVSFVNEYGKDSLGKCCSGSTTKTGRCTGVCKTRFRVCLKQYQAKIDTTSTCTYGDVVTPVLGDNKINLQSNVALPHFTNPIRFPFDFTWPGTFSLIVEALHDNTNNLTHGGTTGEVLITRLTTQRWLDVGSQWIEDEHRSSHARMLYEYRVTCAPHYFGAGCEFLCRPRDDNFGHYTCSPTGERVCLSGWKGDYCNIPHCLPGCNELHGQCQNPNECTCHKGWTGPFCDQCIRYPGCHHGSCQKPWECLCNEGWGGLFCNQDLNYCTNHKPCMNGGTCFNTGEGSYTCSCAPGFTGTDCDTPLLDCHSKPCLNNGTCSVEKNATMIPAYSISGNSNNNNNNNNNALIARNYRCTCPPGWRGPHCEISSRSCRDSPCSRGATCEDDSYKGFVCHCPIGYSGIDCETQINECASNPCANGGTCDDIVNGFKCTCPTGFVGTRCEINVDDCQGDPCFNGGTCIDLINGFRCNCVPGYVGRVCQEKVDYCLHMKPCANGGLCTSGTNDYHCVCKPGFTGNDCSIDVDECKSSPCRNGGTCRNRGNGYKCECPAGWRGDNCEVHNVGTLLLPTTAASPKVQNAPPSGASYLSGNLSRQVASAEPRDAGLTTEHVVVIATLSVAVPAFVLVAALAVMCMKRRQKREQAKADEEARLQNERNAVHSSMTKRSAVSSNGNHGMGLGGGLVTASGVGSVCALGAGDAHMIKNTWTANKSVNNTSQREDLDCSFQTDATHDSSCSGYKVESVMQDVRSTRTTKQLNTEAAAHRASHLFQKEKDCALGLGLGIGCAVGISGLESKRSSSLFSASTTDSCCAEAALLKRPNALTDGLSGGGSTDTGCGVYVIDDHYRHDPTSVASTLATEV